ncbi:hypothetical protein KL86CLO1_10496 [uncultured Eubacteriales bacterium]|uniref:Transmembrane protein n=1 Tax=uncultured Eubacteriales bacterium TaxID=172733 RepID=A0A212J4C7_9FIRM|nr:hypothetical protein KL86CLO1_10496 [uncultured Eubacteriales bacterium]
MGLSSSVRSVFRLPSSPTSIFSSGSRLITSAGSCTNPERAMRSAVSFRILASSFLWLVFRVSISPCALMTSSPSVAGSPVPPKAFTASAAVFRAVSAAAARRFSPSYLSEGTKLPSLPTTRSTSFPSLPLPFRASSTWALSSSPNRDLMLSVIMLFSFLAVCIATSTLIAAPVGLGQGTQNGMKKAASISCLNQYRNVLRYDFLVQWPKR